MCLQGRKEWLGRIFWNVFINGFFGSFKRQECPQFSCTNGKEKTPEQQAPWVLPEGFSGKFLSGCQLSRTRSTRT